jgi:hypothetical protein
MWRGYLTGVQQNCFQKIFHHETLNSKFRRCPSWKSEIVRVDEQKDFEIVMSLSDFFKVPCHFTTWYQFFRCVRFQILF